MTDVKTRGKIGTLREHTDEFVHSTNYYNTLICPADDCRATARIPDKPGSVAAMQYDMLAERPYQMTSDTVLSTVAGRRKGVATAEMASFRTDYFSRGQPCFRASPLTKTHGWAVHSNSEGQVALVSPNGDAFARLKQDASVTKVTAMNNKRR